MLRLRALDADDYIVFDDGHMIGRIWFARDRSPALWLWTPVVAIQAPPFGDAMSLKEAEAKFQSAWDSFKQRHGPEELAKAFEQMTHVNRPGRFGR
ncbi:hypothetical protein XI06_07350 [Bradyrhizobium sp. CCBAU 11434]|uniref:hypothetical protein n=1 Tax=Bradyrhizobium sp. CCBAU 11434 TaxID=1630885 RepID=UPI00230687F0|nr:hypothetical protein [Bradyrhizobium sp. CCBAU 11434]MDA9520170.1 hypothetical protein [Bradyrhizobium sp. CCBAU 11434]